MQTKAAGYMSWLKVTELLKAIFACEQNKGVTMQASPFGVYQHKKYNIFGDGGFLPDCEDFGRMIDHSFPT